MSTSVRLSQLKGNNSCFSKRSRELNLSNGKDDRYDQFVFQKEVIKNWFWSKSLRDRDYDVKTAIMLIQDKIERDLVEDDLLYVYDGVKSILRTNGNFDLRTGAFDETKAFMAVKLASRRKYVYDQILRTFRSFDLDTRESARLLGEDVAARIFRYLDEEDRSLTVPAAKDLDLFGQEVKGARPDLLYRDPRDKVIEAIRIRCGKPDCSKSGRRPDRNVLNNKELYGIYAYARSEAEKEKDPASWDCRGSYYFLRKDTDRTDHLDPYFFYSSKSMKHVATLSGNPVSIDAAYKPQFAEYIIGHDCDGDDCLDCDWYQLCHFAEAPLKTEVERREKPLSAISLSAKQDEVVRHRTGIMRCNAGAGSGKTTVVSLNTAFMIAEGIDPKAILLITFSNAGAGEMKDRVRSYLKGLGIDLDVDEISIVTFNEFGQNILNSEFKSLGFTAPPRPIDATERSAIIARLLDKKTIPGLYYQNINLKFKGFGGARLVTEAAFEIIKRERLTIYDEAELMNKMSDWYSSISDNAAYKALLELYEEYDDTLKARNLIEFADQESMVFDVLSIDPYYFDKMGYKHIIIDEFQDTSKNQMEIIKNLLDVSDFESLLVVGDDSQAIYGWRDADNGNIIEFEERIGQPVTDVNLVENHRSTPEILAFANAVNALNKKRVEKDLIATRPSGKPVTVKGFHKVDKEYDYIVKIVKEKISEGYAPEDIAILARTKTEIVKIAGKLTEAGIESSLQAPQKMLENSRVQAICSFAKAYKDHTATREVLIFQNCLEGGKILSLTDEEIGEAIDDGQQVILHLRSLFEPKRAEAFREIANDLAGDDDVAINLAERLKRFVTTDDMVSYIDSFIRFGGEDLKREGLYSGVVLSTAHSSKGLEWPVVINSITKYDKKDGMSNDEREEQRRLLFVSSTRARDELYITGQIRLSGTAEEGYAVNRFVEEAATITGTPLDYNDEEGIKERAEKREKRIKEEAEKRKAKAAKAVAS